MLYMTYTKAVTCSLIILCTDRYLLGDRPRHPLLSPLIPHQCPVKERLHITSEHTIILFDLRLSHGLQYEGICVICNCR